MLERAGRARETPVGHRVADTAGEPGVHREARCRPCRHGFGLKGPGTTARPTYHLKAPMGICSEWLM